MADKRMSLPVLVYQGVNFRYYTQKEWACCEIRRDHPKYMTDFSLRAQKLGIRGHCYNHSDSSVQGVAVGSSEKVDQLCVMLYFQRNIIINILTVESG